MTEENKTPETTPEPAAAPVPETAPVPTAAPASAAAPMSARPTGAPYRAGGPPRGRGDKRERRGPGEGGRFRRPGRKPCRFCADKIVLIDYKDVNKLRTFVTERGKILPRRMTGTCSRHQRALTQAIKRARNIAMLPFMVK